MANLNKVFLMGNLTRDPELRYTPNGTAVTDFGMAINRKYKEQEEVIFVDVVAWARSAEVISEYCRKGRPLFVEGRLKLDSWEGKDGQKRSRLKVVLENFQFIGAKPGGDASSENRGAAKSSGPGRPPAAPSGDGEGAGGDNGQYKVADDIPF